MFGHSRAYKLLHQSYENAQCHNEQLKERIQGLEKQLQTLESDIKAYQETIQDKDNALETLRNTANARLSALIGLKRYLDTFFEDGQTTAPTSQQEKATKATLKN